MQSELAKIGFEIEGEWTEPLLQIVKQSGEIKGDGSVHRCGYYSFKTKDMMECAKLEGKLAREYNSKAIVIDESGIREIQAFFTLLNDAYLRKDFHWNESCGFHIHVSFNNSMAPEIFSHQFIKFFKNALFKRQKRAIALRKNNQFCKLSYSKKEVGSRNAVDRYRFVNLWPSLSKHGTIEFRIFPTNKPKIMFRYIMFTLGQLRLFLKKSFNETTVIALPTNTPKMVNFSCEVPFSPPRLIQKSVTPHIETIF